MFKMFDFSFETCIKIISPLINRLINEALLVADRFNQMLLLSASAYRRNSYLAGF